EMSQRVHQRNHNESEGERDACWAEGAMGVCVYHDRPGADQDQEEGADAFGERSAPAARVRRSLCHSGGQVVTGGTPTPPISLTCCCRARFSSFSIGRARKRSSRRLIKSSVSSKARCRSVSVPVASAGSAMPQWAMTGCPGKIGHDSFARSQTVITKSHGSPITASSPCGGCPVQK